MAWIFIVGSRLPSQWLGGWGGTPDALQDGNDLDRLIYSGLILLALWILVARSVDWSKFFTANLALTVFLSFTLVSIAWSEYPLVATKRWFRDLGTYLAILVVLSDPRPFAAVRTVLRRVFFLLIPLCILLIKYFPDLGREYSPWTGETYFIGAATSKNMLGVLCLVSGLFFFWDVLSRWEHRAQPQVRRVILVDAVMLAMTFWLATRAGSATSNVCLALGCLVIAAMHTRAMRRRPTLLIVLIPVGICLYLLLDFGLQIDIIAFVAEALGRDPDLTGRTNIWSVVLATNTNPYIGTGYESFWLGPRLLWIWERTTTPITQAHNGYLETYLNLGLAGLILLSVFLVVSYRNILRISTSSSRASLALALWTILLFYNMTEAAFRGQLLWIVFLLAVLLPAPGLGFQPGAYRSRQRTPNKWHRAPA